MISVRTNPYHAMRTPPNDDLAGAVKAQIFSSGSSLELAKGAHLRLGKREEVALKLIYYRFKAKIGTWIGRSMKAL